MGLFDFLKKKTARPDNFTEEGREEGNEKRLENSIHREKMKMLRSQLERIRQAREENDLRHQLDMEEEMYMRETGTDDDEEEPEEQDYLNPDQAITTFLMTALSKLGTNQPQTPAPQAQTGQNYDEMTDEQLRQIKQKIPTLQLKALKQLKNEDLINVLRDHVPGASDKILERAAMIIKE